MMTEEDGSYGGEDLVRRCQGYEMFCCVLRRCRGLELMRRKIKEQLANPSLPIPKMAEQ